MNDELEELSLLVWLSRGSKKTLIKLMCEYTGCEAETYTDNQIIKLFEHTLIDISRKYHIRSLLYEYFSNRHNRKDFTLFCPSKYTETDVEIDSLGTTIFSIMPSIFDEKDLARIKQLTKDYIAKIDHKEE